MLRFDRTNRTIDGEDAEVFKGFVKRIQPMLIGQHQIVHQEIAAMPPEERLRLLQVLQRINTEETQPIADQTGKDIAEMLIETAINSTVLSVGVVYIRNMEAAAKALQVLQADRT